MAANRLSMRAGGRDRPGSSTTADHPGVPGVPGVPRVPGVPEPRDGHQPDREVCGGPSQIAALVEAAYERALGNSGEGPPVWGYRAVARLSGHLAAMHRAVYPAARQRLGDDQQLLQRCRAESRETAWALHVLQGHLAGDGGTTARQPGVVHLWLEECLDEYRSAEQALITWMHERLTAREHDQLAACYRAALARAPTRPHPRGPHSRWPGRVAFRLHALCDGLLDAVDSRPGVGRAP